MLARLALLSTLLVAALPAVAHAAPVVTIGDVAIDGAVVDEEVERLRVVHEYGLRDARRFALTEIAGDEWVRQEAATLGIAASEADVDAGMARERRLLGRSLRQVLRQSRWTEERLREEVAQRHLRRLLGDRFFADARTDEEYGARFFGFASGWRARTTCAEGYLVRDVCGNAPPPRIPCHELGPVELCFFPKDRRTRRFWSIFSDAAADLWLPSNHVVEERLIARLRRTRPSLLRRIELDSEADFLGISAPYRAPLVAVARVLHRMSLGKPTAPVVGVYGG